MRSALVACLIIGTLLVVAEPTGSGRARPAGAAPAEFGWLFDARHQTRDPEERIRLGEQALAIEKTLTH